MSDAEIYSLYILQSKNVRKLKQAARSLNRDINASIQKNDMFKVDIKTKLAALLYCTLSEAQYIQILHTPNGFHYSEILQIKSQRSITDKWKLMIDLAMRKVGDWTANPDLLSRRERLHKIIDEYIKKPQGLRNKIAHGQWLFALNSDNSKENTELTADINRIDVVRINIWSSVHQYLAEIIRDIVQSPKNGHHNNYWVSLVKLEEFLIKSSAWTFQDRRERILRKKK